MHRFGASILVVATILFAGFSFADTKKDDVEAGRKLFEANCQICHNPESTETLVGPGLAGLSKGKLPKSGEEATRKNLRELLEKGRPDGDPMMPPFGEVLSKKEKEAVIDYLLTL